MAKENIVNSSLRFNLENEQHLRVYQYLCKMDSDVYGSRNKFVIQALDAYFKGGGELIVEDDKEQREREELLKRIFEMTQEAVFKALGAFYAGGFAGNWGAGSGNGDVLREEKVEDNGVTNMEVLGLIEAWNE